MILASTWTKSTVFWRMFNWDDNTNAAGLHDGTFHTVDLKAFQWNLTVGKFKLELKEDGVFGNIIMGPRLVFNSDKLILFNSGLVRNFLDPEISFSLPVAGASLDQSRLGKPDRVSAKFHINDLKYFITIEDYLSDVQVVIIVRQPGYPDAEFPTTLNSSINDPAFAQYDAELRITHSGPAELTAEMRSQDVSKQLTSQPLSVTVAATAARSFIVEFDGHSGTNPEIPVPVSGKTIPVKILADANEFFKEVDIQSSQDNQLRPITSDGQETRNGQLMQKWKGSIYAPPNMPPSSHFLRIFDVDFFGSETFSQNFNFSFVDNTPPKIEIFYPLEDREIYLPEGQLATDVIVKGRVDDGGQSGYQAGTLTYIFENQQPVTIQPDADASGRFTFTLRSVELGVSKRLTITARDNSLKFDPHGNLGQLTREFSVASKYTPKSIDDLLNQRNYLADLIRFTTSHIFYEETSQSNPLPLVSSTLISASFMPEETTGVKDFFSVASDPGSVLGDRVVNELLPTVALLRLKLHGLIMHFGFESEQGQETRDSGPLRLSASLSKPGLIGTQGTKKRTLTLDEAAYASVGGSNALRELSKLGEENSDFSISFWIYIDSRGEGVWRSVLYKGHENNLSNPTQENRTFAMFLYPDSNILHYRIGTKNHPNEGRDSTRELPVGEWTHVAYVKRGNLLEIYFKGTQDSFTKLSNDVVANNDTLYIGKSPYAAGFRGALDDLVIYDFALSTDDILQLARYRSSPVLIQSSLSAYIRSAYEALLIAHGTSYEELRALPARGSDERRAIAVRIGLGLSEPNTDDDLDVLLLPTTLSDEGLEIWLSDRFGLPMTREMLIPIGNSTGRGNLLDIRRNYLSRRWLMEDQEIPLLRPLLDPDLVETDDLILTHQLAQTLLRERRQALHDQWIELRNKPSVNEALLFVYSQDMTEKFEDIENTGLAGNQIAELLSPLGLTIAGFRRLRFYQQLQQMLSEREKDDLAHLLTQAWKLYTLYPQWLNDEQSLIEPLWPNSRSGGAFVSGYYKRDFLPWRGNVSDRIRFEKLVATRLGVYEALALAHEQAVLEAQRTALPLFRDKLLAISDLPSAFDVMDDLTKHLLVDVASTGTLTRSLIEHAILTLQRLIDGVRLKQFETGHPAAKWLLRTDWPNVPEIDPDFSLFDEEWSWMGTYGMWRSAKATYLYPENRLFPDLRFPDLRTDPNGPLIRPYPTVPYVMSLTFRDTFLKALRKLAPSAPDGAWVDINSANVSYAEDLFFVPVAIGVMLERARKYILALDWYRKVYDYREKDPLKRPKAPILIVEIGKNKPPRIQYDDRWTLDSDPHTNASRRFGNHYTRFILLRITTCLVGLADEEFARGTDESRARAQDLYLEAKQILTFDDLVDLPPANDSQAYLPNPMFRALREHLSASLRKLRQGLTYIGTPVVADQIRSGEGISALLRPTPYRFRVLMERAKQLVALAQNLEAQYLSALEKRDGEAEKVLGQRGNVAVLFESVSLRELQKTEAFDGVVLAQQQQSRSQLLRDRYAGWIAAGRNEHEQAQVDHMWESAWAKDFLAIARGGTAVTNFALSTLGAEDIISFGAVKGGKIGLLSAANAIEIGAQTAVNHLENAIQLESVLSSWERRVEEWQLQRDLAGKDILIANQQYGLAKDREKIATKEHEIAKIQFEQASDMLKFLSAKFTSVEFYEWMGGVLTEVYAFLLRTATMVAFQAEGQLAFERQQTSAGLIKQDYWNLSSLQSTSTPDRRGMTGTARLLQDITALDQYAFDSERRFLNLSQTFSMARLLPIEFEEFRQTGILNFATTLRMFDEGFPGHYMRLIKRIRISVAALIPPSQGIRATLSTSGLSRVVTGDPSFPTMVIRQDPQSVALTAPTAATGVFELDMQSELLFPFEGIGVDTNWTLELPPAGNPFDYDTLFDVMMSIEYTALTSIELRDRVVKQLPPLMIGDRAFSIRRDLADNWYDLVNSSITTSKNITLTLSRSDFPSQLKEIEIREIAFTVRRNDGKLCDFKVKPSVLLADNNTYEASEANAIKGIASSRRSGAATWPGLIARGGNILQEASTWTFALSDASGQSDSVLELLRNNEVDDILIVFTFSGMKPLWSSA